MSIKDEFEKAVTEADIRNLRNDMIKLATAVSNLLAGQKMHSEQIENLEGRGVRARQESEFCRTAIDTLNEHCRHARERISNLESINLADSIQEVVKSEFRRVWEESRKSIPQGQVVYNQNGIPLGVYIDGKIEKEARVVVDGQPVSNYAEAFNMLKNGPGTPPKFDLESLSATVGDAVAPNQDYAPLGDFVSRINNPSNPSLPVNDESEMIVKRKYPEAYLKGFGYQYAVVVASGEQASGSKIIGEKCWFGTDAWKSAATEIQSYCPVCNGTGRISTDPTKSVFENDCVWSVCGKCGGKGKIEEKSTETRQDWMIARDEVLKRWPDAVCEKCESVSCGSNGYVIRKSHGEVPAGEWGETIHDAWIKQWSIMNIWEFDQPAAKTPLPPALEPWQIARDEVLAKYPDAKCHKTSDGGHEITTTKENGHRVNTEWLGGGVTESDAWQWAASNIRNNEAAEAIRAAQSAQVHVDIADSDQSAPAPSIWSREIPSESGWYWWKPEDDYRLKAAEWDADRKEIRCESWRFDAIGLWPDCRFGPRIPDAETLVKMEVVHTNPPLDIEPDHPF